MYIDNYNPHVTGTFEILVVCFFKDSVNAEQMNVGVLVAEALLVMEAVLADLMEIHAPTQMSAMIELYVKLQWGTRALIKVYFITYF